MCHHTAPSMSYTRSIRPKYWCTGCCFYTGRECWCCHSRGFQSEERTWLLNKSRTRSWIFDESKFLRPDSVRTVMRFWWDCQISASKLWMRFSTKGESFSRKRLKARLLWAGAGILHFKKCCTSLFPSLKQRPWMPLLFICPCCQC